MEPNTANMPLMEPMHDVLLSVTRAYPPMAPLVIDITPRERAALTKLGDMLALAFGSYENPAFIAELHLHAFQLLPERISRILSSFGTDFSASQYGAIVLRGLVNVDQDQLGPTPPSYKQMDYTKINRYGFICALLHGAVPSKPVQYYAQRKGGGLLHAIIPDEKMNFTQTGSGSRTDLFVHTEDAFLFNAADFLSFLFLRNEENVPSSLYSIRSHGMLGPEMEALFQPIYKCPKDANYDADMAKGEEVTTPVLYGNRENPFIRFDAAEQIYNEAAGQTPEAMAHLKHFWEEARQLIYNDYIPESGDLIFVNNHLCAHGRNAFVAGYRKENDRMVKCERRMMLRMMSKTSLIGIRGVTHADDPYLIMEEHYGSLFK
ncbi:taurine catabolism dioxygenase TauD [Chitinophaga sancti]|uniref:taurine catabolism dioxygenase TauD n=1 Tax=Chitinophaga sancti TaxID=1004 RepID=UPI002A756D6C|nr:taurine catabolism dioxygenase TauD [Chitinophaga sancti]WPQ61030.1 taurine catabolism dioxygenase TauD [Chitinophaga sancti]